LKAIVTVDSRNAIGYKNNLLIKIPEQMEWFKELTYDKIILMGKNTFLSVYDQNPLDGRINIVLSSSLKNDENYDNLIICQNIDHFIHYMSRFVYVVGGESVYRQLLPYCDELYLTRIFHTFPEADSYFPPIDQYFEWGLVEKSENKIYNGYNYRLERYINRYIVNSII